MADVITATGATARAAETLLRAAGGRAVMLRIPAPASAGDIAEQLGLETPEFQDVELAPAVFRKAHARMAENKAARYELLVSAAAVQSLVGSLGYAAANALFSTAFGILVDGVLLTIESVTDSEANGAPYLYRLLLRAPIAEMV